MLELLINTDNYLVPKICDKCAKNFVQELEHIINKKEKLLQYAYRVWNIEKTDADSDIEKAISMTEDFFNKVGVPTKFSAYEIKEENI